MQSGEALWGSNDVNACRGWVVSNPSGITHQTGHIDLESVFCLGRFCRARHPAPFWWRPAFFFKAEMTPCLFCKKNYCYFIFFVKKAGHHFIIMLMMMMKWRPHNPGPTQLPPWNASHIEHFILTCSYGGKSYTTYWYGAIQVLRNADGGGGGQFFRGKALRRCKVQCY